MGVRRRSRELVGVVLHSRVFGEAHRIVEALTAEEGRVCLLARGGRASRRRFAGALDLFVSLRMQVIPGKDLWTLSTADVLSQRPGLRTDLDRIRRASHLCDCVRSVVPERVAAPEVYAALSRALDLLDKGELHTATAAYRTLLVATGIMPDLGACPRCREQAAPLTVDLDVSGHGLLCSRCAPGRPRLPQAVMRALAGSEVAGGDEVAVWDDEQTAELVEQLALTCVEAHTGRVLRSRALDPTRLHAPSGRNGQI